MGSGMEDFAMNGGSAVGFDKHSSMYAPLLLP